jgi:hypothetical protein
MHAVGRVWKAAETIVYVLYSLCFVHDVIRLLEHHSGTPSSWRKDIPFLTWAQFCTKGQAEDNPLKMRRGYLVKGLSLVKGEQSETRPRRPRQAHYPYQGEVLRSPGGIVLRP